MSIDSISQTIDRALAAAGLHTKTGTLKSVTDTIKRALTAAGLAQVRRPVPGADAAELRKAQPMPPAASGPAARGNFAAEDVGQFLSLSFATARASRSYKLYIPSSHGREPVPLIVMLHGCKQSPDDFASGTRMNELAEREGFLVAYPAQTARNNGANCWNWFDAKQQRRDGIEPELLAEMVREISRSHAVDPSRVFVAGLSAGAAMAVVLGTTYPDVFAGVAAHSGLPLGAAHDVMSAFSAMQGVAESPRSGSRGLAVPTIVFHGDADPTVARSNGVGIVEQALQGYSESGAPLQQLRRECGALGGTQFTTTAYADANGKHRVEEWVVHGGSHAWSGGSAKGSYTDTSGPDASAEIVRFFLGQRSLG